MEEEVEVEEVDVVGGAFGDGADSGLTGHRAGNTGNAQTLNQAISYLGTDPSPSGSADITLTPNEDVDEVFQCTVETNQAASASG